MAHGGVASRKNRTARRAAQRVAPTETAVLTADAPGLFDRRAAVRRAFASAGIEESAKGPLSTIYDMSRGSLAERMFYAAALDAGFTEMTRDAWPCEGSLDGASNVLFRDGDDDIVYRYDDGTLAYASLRQGWFHTMIAAETRDTVGETVSAFRVAYPALFHVEGDDSTAVPITFWTYNKNYGASSRLRLIEAASWADIEHNYSGAARGQLAGLMDGFEPGKNGQLILWQGSPGTGKSWALRALASEWAEWAEFSYITDPDAFFVGYPDYLIDVLLHDSYEEMLAPSAPGDDSEVVTTASEGKWRVLILEDTGELLAANAKESYGQGLSRLLNTVDGMIGQGLRILVLVTTNDELDELHPAVARPGRCAAQIEFSPFTADEASEWLGSEVDEPVSLAELYHRRGEATAAFAVGECADCGHMADQHEGGGACTMADCSCEGYAEAEIDGEESVQASGLAVSEGTLTADLIALASEGDLPPEHQPGESLPERHPSPLPPAPVETAGEKRWTASFAPEGVPTDDGREFAPGSITWRDLPLSLMAMTKTADGHDGAEVAGRIDRIWREGNMIRGEGVFDDSEFGVEIARMVAEGMLRGISVDIAPKQVEVTIDEDGNQVYLVTEAVIGCVTVCPFPAFAEASISLVASAGEIGDVWTYTSQGGIVVTQAEDETLADLVEFAASPLPEVPSLTASAAHMAPVSPPAAWFDNPELAELTPLVVTGDGRVYGHLAAFDQCHIGIPGICTTAPHSDAGYDYFHLGQVECDDGELVTVGKVTLGTGHADASLGFRAAIDHYDHTGTVVADVCAGEDDFGIWVAGAVRPDVDAARVRELRAAPLSGDWRRINGHLELIAALAVNVPGFPIPRTRALVASTDKGPEVFALVAAGIHRGEPPRDAFVVDQATLEKIAALAAQEELDALAGES